jgi:hypothetical protein
MSYLQLASLLRHTHTACLASFYIMVCQYADETMKNIQTLRNAISHTDSQVSIHILPFVLHQPCPRPHHVIMKCCRVCRGIQQDWLKQSITLYTHTNAGSRLTDVTPDAHPQAMASGRIG